MTNSETEEVTELRDAIIELYLAIKIRSTEEVSILSLSCLNLISNEIFPDYNLHHFSLTK